MGCIHWTFEADGAVTSATVIGTAGGLAKRPAAYFGDQKANVYAVDAASGKLVWKVQSTTTSPPESPPPRSYRAGHAVPAFY